MPILFSADYMGPSNTSTSVALNCRRFGDCNNASAYLSHSRWFDESGTEPPDPTIVPVASVDHNSGKLTGVTSLYSVMSYRLPTETEAVPANTGINARGRSIAYGTGQAWYPADFVVTWGAGGAITVRDSTHRTNLVFKQAFQPGGYGFTNAAAYAAITQTNLCSADASGSFTAGQCSGGAAGVVPTAATVGYRHLYFHWPVSRLRGTARVDLQSTAVIEPLDMNNDGAADANGIALTINGETFLMAMAALPAAGTKWHLRAVGGDGMVATCTPALAAGVSPTDCSGYSFAPGNTVRPPYAPGLSYKVRVTQAFAVASGSGDLTAVHTVPDPYYVTNALEQTANTKVLRFVNLPDRAIIRIYSASGILVNIVNHNNVQGGGEEVWNLRNRNNQFVASGVYYFHVEAPDGQTHVGRFTVVNFAQ